MNLRFISDLRKIIFVSDWDNIGSFKDIPRNDPKLDREPRFQRDMRKAFKVARAGAEVVDAWKPYKDNSIKPPRFKKRQQASAILQKLEKSDPVATDHKKRARQMLHEMKQEFRTENRYHRHDRKDKKKAKNSLTWVIFFVLTLLFIGFIRTLGGGPMIFSFIVIWIVAANIAQSFIGKE